MNILSKIANKFSKKSQQYNDYIDIQKVTANEIIELIKNKVAHNSLILDIGSGTGYFSERLQQYKIIQLDVSYNMCKSSVIFSPAVNADMHNMPIKNESFDCVTSSFSLHWAEDLQQVFDEVYNTLKPNGLFIFSIPTQESLKEVKEVLELQNLSNIINEFATPREVITLLSEFQILSKSQKSETLKYDNLIDFLRRIKSIGASQKISDTSKITKYTIMEASELYQKKYTDNAGKIKIFWNNLFIVARKI